MIKMINKMKLKLPAIPQKLLIILGIVFILVLACIPSYYFYSQYQKSQKLLQDPTLATKEEVKAIIAKVSKLIDLPGTEEPTIATVSDKEKIKDQAFFQKAENGDKVLIYTKERKAILFRPSLNKIIEVAPINLGQPQENSPTVTTTATISPKAAQVKPVKVAIYNGTNIAGQTKRAEASISARLSNMSVVAKEDASKKDYQKTVVVDLSGNFNNQTNQLVQLFKGAISKLPEGEKKPAADILVIIGDNFNK